MGFLHLQLAWHLLPSREQEHGYRQALLNKHELKGTRQIGEKYSKGAGGFLYASFESLDCDLAATSQFCVITSLSFSACGFHPLARRLLTVT